MTEEDIVIGLDDIERDLEGTRKAEARIAAFFRRGDGPGWVRTRGGAPATPASAESPAGIGRRLLAHCPADTQQRYRTLLHFESAMLPDGDYGSLIAPACHILEAELRRLLAAPARPIAAHLVAALNAKKQQQQAELLGRWGRGALQTTLGVLSLLLYALRKGEEQSLPEIVRFLADRFRPRFAELLRTRKLDASLESVRTRHRNPADHAERVFGAAAYADFARLVIGNRLFAAWDTDGPDPSDPDAGTGILYHHLQQALAAAPGNPVGKEEVDPR